MTKREIEERAAMEEHAVMEAAAAEAEANAEAEAAEQAQTESDAPPEAQTAEDAEREEFYRSQKEIDNVIGKRLHQERERWERQHAGAMLLEKAAGDMPKEQAAALLIARANGLDEHDVMDAMARGASLAQIVQIARESGVGRQAEAIAAADPGFDLNAAMESPAFRALVEAGEPLEKAYAYLTMDSRIEAERSHARDEIMRSIQSRRTRPGSLRPAGAGAAGGADHMPDSVIRMIDGRLKRGEKVRI